MINNNTPVIFRQKQYVLKNKLYTQIPQSKKQSPINNEMVDFFKNFPSINNENQRQKNSKNIFGQLTNEQYSQDSAQKNYIPLISSFTPAESKVYKSSSQEQLQGTNYSRFFRGKLHQDLIREKCEANIFSQNQFLQDTPQPVKLQEKKLVTSSLRSILVNQIPGMIKEEMRSRLNKKERLKSLGQVEDAIQFQKKVGFNNSVEIFDLLDGDKTIGDLQLRSRQNKRQSTKILNSHQLYRNNIFSGVNFEGQRNYGPNLRKYLAYPQKLQ